MVSVGCVQQWQCIIFLGWLLTWYALPGPVASAPVVSAPVAVVQSTAVFFDSGGSNITSGVGTAAPASPFAEETLPPVANHQRPHGGGGTTTELHLPPGSHDQLSNVDVGGDNDDSGYESTRAPGAAASSTESDATDDGDADKAERVVSLVPLFVLLASFLLVIVTCVVVCQRIRNRHKSRFHREEQDYRVQSAAYQLIASDGNGCHSAGHHSRSSLAANGKCLSLDDNGNRLGIRDTLVDFVDTTSLAATVVSCVRAPAAAMMGAPGAAGKRRSALADARVNGSVDCRDGSSEDAPLLKGHEQLPQDPAATTISADVSAKAVGSGEVVKAGTSENKSNVAPPVDPKASVIIVASATAANEQGRKSCLTQGSAVGAGGTGGGGGGGGGSVSSHCVTFADDDVTTAVHNGAVRKALSLKSVKRSPPPPLRNNFGVDATKNVTFHVVDGKSLKVAFLDKSLTVHGPDGRNFKVARLQPLPNSSSTNALTALLPAVASPQSARSLDTIRQQPGSGRGSSSGGVGGTVAPAVPRARHRSLGGGSSSGGGGSNRHRAKKHSMSSSSPNSSSVPSSPRDQQPLVTFDGQLDGAAVVQPSQSSAVVAATARTVSSSGVKKRDSRSARARRGNRPLSAAPRLVGAAAAAAVAGTRAPLRGLHGKLHGSPPFVVDDSYEPDDGEDTDDSDVGAVRRYQRRRAATPAVAGKQRQLSSSVVHRANVLDSGGSSSCNS